LQAVGLADILGVTLEKPRLTSRQCHRPNIHIDAIAQDYYRVTGTIYLPFVDSVLCQLRERFSGHFAVVKKLSLLVPGIGIHHYPECTPEMICEAVDFYATILDKEKLASELRSWNYKWRNAAQVDTALPMNALDVIGALQCCILPEHSEVTDYTGNTSSNHFVS